MCGKTGSGTGIGCRSEVEADGKYGTGGVGADKGLGRGKSNFLQEIAKTAQLFYGTSSYVGRSSGGIRKIFVLIILILLSPV